MKGAVKLMAVAVGRGTYRSAVMKIRVEMQRSVDRASCRPGREAARSLSPRRGANAMSM
jgi:hypothetical protein